MTKINFWKDEEKTVLDHLLFSTVAENFSKEIRKDHDEEKNEKGKNTYPNKPAQIRKFYDEIVRLNMEVKNSKKDKDAVWNNILPMVNMVTAKAAYARGRNLISENFLDFLRDQIQVIEKKEDLDIFTNFFEAFYGFYKLHGPQNWRSS